LYDRATFYLSGTGLVESSRELDIPKRQSISLAWLDVSQREFLRKLSMTTALWPDYLS
jgi:hypothetical protein